MENSMIREECTVWRCAESNLEHVCYIGIEVSKQSSLQAFQGTDLPCSLKFGSMCWSWWPSKFIITI